MYVTGDMAHLTLKAILTNVAIDPNTKFSFFREQDDGNYHLNLKAFMYDLELSVVIEAESLDVIEMINQMLAENINSRRYARQAYLNASSGAFIMYKSYEHSYREEIESKALEALLIHNNGKLPTLDFDERLAKIKSALMIREPLEQFLKQKGFKWDLKDHFEALHHGCYGKPPKDMVSQWAEEAQLEMQ
tara:strand:- start:1081 stop:1650 length:570 start_codon:yes stop_codon:yes gene_type:complete